MKTKIITLFAVLTVAALTTTNLQAYINTPLVVDANLTLQRQGVGGVSGSTETSTVEKVKIGTIDLLDLVADTLGISPLPAGAKLVLYNYDKFFILDINNNILAEDFADILSYVEGDNLEKGKLDTLTDKQSYAYTFISTIQFDDGFGSYFEFRGITAEKYSNTAPDTGGSVKTKDSFKITGSGDGVFDGETIILNGTLTGKGSIVTGGI